MYGQTHFAAGGPIADAPYVWKRYGAVPEEVYRGLNYGEEKHVHGELDAAVTAYLKAVVAKPNRKLPPRGKSGLKGILDAYFGEVPETFEYKGKTYTHPAALPMPNPSTWPTMFRDILTHHPPLTTRLSPWRCPTTGFGRSITTCPRRA